GRPSWAGRRVLPTATQPGRWPQRLRTGPELRDPRCQRTPRRGLAALLGYPRTLFSCRLQFSAWLADALDRKSTRLNSSHVSISYAVFFLKKKNKRITSLLY